MPPSPSGWSWSRNAVGRNRILITAAISPPQTLLVYGYAGMWGHPALFASIKQRGLARDEAMEKLRAYMADRKQQMRCDRSLGLLLDQCKEIVCVICMNDLPTDDPDLDALGTAIGLRPVGESHWPLPVRAARDPPASRPSESQAPTLNPARRSRLTGTCTGCRAADYCDPGVLRLACA